MKTVTLFRHAKSAWKDNPEIDDFDRPVSAKGLDEAPAMGANIRKHGLNPDLILCSPSLRTRQTLSLAAGQAWDTLPETRFEESIYQASALTLFKMFAGLPAHVAHVMIVGHNPALQELAANLAPSGSEARHRFEDHMPTAALACFDFAIENWTELRPGTGQLRLFIFPATNDN
jgi:phosphohistidine phosphatase